MITIEGAGTDLAKVAGGGIAKQDRVLTVGQLELALLARFPRSDAEEWDRTGLLVGDPATTVKGVAVALDPTRDAVIAAADAGANVLLTHHPAFLDPPAAISPSYEVAPAPGVVVYEAVRRGVALVNFHTALDVSHEATHLLSSMLNLDFQRILVPSGNDPDKGYGQLCTVRPSDAPLDVAHLAARCTSVFKRTPRVWGDFASDIDTVVVANGSAGNVVDACLRAGASCLVCGEIRYHTALDALQAGLNIIELGHDASELPLAAVLARAAADAGIASDCVHVLEQSPHWTTPETTRL
ncbi:MAG TPA: NGG1p interacting factor NIF3 [Eggerthellaceae bacterium]|nr:NGG1p interacting factor NIF3 [Eggerthellaceae bacterium]